MDEQKKNQQQTTEGVRKRGRALHSIRMQIIVLVLIAIALTSGIFLWTIIPLTKTNLMNLTHNYMNDMAASCGTMLDKAVSVDAEALSAETLQSLVGDVSINDVASSYAYVVSGDGTMLYHPTAEKIGQPVENEVVTKIVADIKSGNIPAPDTVEYVFKGVVKYAAYYVGADASYILVISADESEVFGVANDIIFRAVAVGIFALVVFGIAGFWLAGRIVKPINKIATIVEKLADMDFTENQEQHKLNRKKDETGTMSRAITQLQGQLQNMVVDIKKQSEEIYNASEHLSGNAKNTAETMEDVERTVTEIADGATSQAQETQKATENVILMGNMVEETNEEVEQLKNNADGISKSSDDAVEILKNLEAINQKTREAIEVIYQQTNTTNESATKIREATAIITSIAEETNLLSLNASIEAARAGEQGRGFAVVAAQIQKLAEQSDESAKQIETIVNSLISDSEKAVETMDVVKDIIEQQSENVEKTNAIFGQVKEGIDSSINGITAIAEKTKKLDEARIVVVDVVQNLTAIAEENAASTEETSASVAEVANVVTEMSSDSERLKKISNNLEDHMEIFKL